MFCDACSTIEFTWPLSVGAKAITETLWDEEGKYIFHTYSSMRDLVVSYQKGCVLCAQIAAAFVRNVYAKKSSPVHLVWAISDKDKVPRRFKAVLDEEVARQKLYWESFRVITVDEKMAHILWDKAELCDTNTGSEANFRLIRLWLNRCLKTHKECALRISALPNIPTRILDVGTTNKPQDPKVVSGVGRFGPYIALSHVWGLEQIITTTKATLKLHALGIPLNLLSKTFQHAVFVARELNIQYLWIDSLCIVQDSVEDWEVESSKMGEYYRNAILTVAATRSKDGRGGCFSDNSNFWLLKPCPTGSSWARSPSGDFKFIRHESSAMAYASSASSSENPLEYRAWCIQERLLSPRLLSYSHEGMRFMCPSSYSSERFPEGTDLAERMDTEYLRSLRDLFSKFGVMSSNRVDSNKESQIEPIGDWYNVWYRLISIYSSCQLTHQTDVLPAISGMAKAFQDISKDVYVAGLWKNNLKRGLLWYARHRNTTSRPLPDQLLGPSWSWTSIIAPRGVEYEFISGAAPTITSSSCCSIIDANSIVKGRNPFGRVERGVLRVSGFLRDIVMPANTDSIWSTWHKYCPELPDLRMQFLVDIESETAVGSKVVLFPVSVFRQGMRRAVLDEVGEDLQDWEVFEKVLVGENGANCLLLVAVDQTDRVYRRVGVVRTAALHCFHGCKKREFRVI